MLPLLFVILVIHQSLAKKDSVYRYYQSSIVDHFYTTNANEIGTTTSGATGNYGYVSEGIGFKLEDSQISGTTPLYRYYHSSVYDHFYTTNADEIGTTTSGATGNYGYVYEGIVGYCFTSQESGTVPLYRYYQSSYYNHFYTTNEDEIGTTTSGVTGNYNYVSEGTECYVYDTDRSLITPSFEVKSSFKDWPRVFSNEPVVYGNWILFAFIGLLIVNVVCLMGYFCKNEFFGNKKESAYKVVKYQDSETENDHLNV